MTILIDINHPAHVHYFKNAVKILRQRGHQMVIVSRDRYPAHRLLDSLDEKYYSRGKGSTHPLGKLFYTLKADLKIARTVKPFRPDLYLSFASPYAHHVARRNKKYSVTFTDTEAAKLHRIFTYPFADVICTPAWFNHHLGGKQVRFNGFMESAYLHPNYFKPDPGVLDLLGVKNKEKYIILRFVSWTAHHDIRQKGLSYENKIKAIKEFSKYATVKISSESPLPGDLQKYQVPVPPEKMHDVLFYASAYFGESPTMTTESALLGTPAVCVSSWACGCGNFQQLKKYRLIDCFSPAEQEDAVRNVLEILKTDSPNLRQERQKRKEQLLNETIDVTAFMVWFIENYPESLSTMKENPGYQLKFKQN